MTASRSALRALSLMALAICTPICALWLAGCTEITQKTSPAAPPGMLAGYLPKGATPNSLAILPAAPEPGSATRARDDAAARAARALKDTLRWTLATRDADLHFPEATGAFSCALGIEISPATTPRLLILMRRSLLDAGLSTYPTKNKYHRPRPFMVSGGDICTPLETDHLRVDGSYPSGHSAVGWAWALILAEAAPDRAEQVLARGRAFMQSRVICNVHWLSDTEFGGVMGASVVARLHAVPEFRKDLEAAAAEISATRAAGRLPSRDCQAEAAAVSLAPSFQP